MAVKVTVYEGRFTVEFKFGVGHIYYIIFKIRTQLLKLASSKGDHDEVSDEISHSSITTGSSDRWKKE